MPHVDQSPNLKSSRSYLVWTILLAGAALRLNGWLDNRSLWGDEANLALNIVNRDFAGLAEVPLDHSQAAPVGYLWLTKAAYLTFGNYELALRLVPLCASIAALPLFWLLAARILPTVGILLATALLAGSPSLIFYAFELKPYASDLTVALLLTWLACRIAQDGVTIANALGLAMCGAASVWFSYPAVFVLAGTGVTLGLQAVVAKKVRDLWALVGVGSFWTVSFAAVYLLCIRTASQSSYLQSYWNDYFFPWPATLRSAAGWFSSVLTEWLTFIVPWPVAPFAALALLLGCWTLWRRSPVTWGLLLYPVIVTLVAAVAHKYPFGSRLWLFLVPAAYLIMANGVAWLYGAGSPMISLRTIFAGLLAVALLGAPAWGIATYAISPPGRCEIRPMMDHLASNVQPGDVVYQFRSRTPYLYYLSQERFAVLRDVPLVQGRVAPRENSEDCRADVERLRGKARVWFLFTHPKHTVPQFLSALDEWGRRLDERHDVDASIYLYDLRDLPATSKLLPRLPKHADLNLIPPSLSNPIYSVPLSNSEHSRAGSKT